jgi:para-nitrobenzyl esterase
MSRDALNFILLTIVLIAAELAGTRMTAAELEPVRIDTGLISGVSGEHDAGVRVFKGVPFAAPPVGPLRWRPPAPVPHWDTVRSADRFSAVCPQPPRTGNAALAGTSQRLGAAAEDCLYLNIWTAAKSSGEKRPVMVWFPGGGFTTGGGSALVFDGEALARKGVVVVTTNYRLGILGFLAHRDLTAESDHHSSGNYGLLDQVAALRWVQRNIQAFGGDPNNVTIFGQSAGATSVSYLMASPLGKGLFSRAIGESGGGTGGVFALWKVLKLTEAEDVGAELMKSLRARSLSDLRSIPADELVRATAGTGTNERVVGTGPIIDGWIVPQDISTVFQKRVEGRVPLLVGSTADDGGDARALPLDKYLEDSKKQYGGLFDTYIKLYPDGSDETIRRLNADTQAWRVWNWARMQSLSGERNVYLFSFSRPAPEGSPAPNRAYHGAEAFFVFHNLHLFMWSWKDLDRQLEEVISSYWVNFAKSGDPNGTNLPKWKAYTAAQQDRLMVLGDKVEVGPSRLNTEKIALFDAYYKQLLSN